MDVHLMRSRYVTSINNVQNIEQWPKLGTLQHTVTVFEGNDIHKKTGEQCTQKLLLKNQIRSKLRQKQSLLNEIILVKTPLRKGVSWLDSMKVMFWLSRYCHQLRAKTLLTRKKKFDELSPPIEQLSLSDII